MKERIVIEDVKKMCDDCQCCDRPISKQVECYLEESRQLYETVKVPETFEELKELCEDLKEIKVEEDYIEIFGALIGSNMLFCQDGAIFLNTDCCFKEKATPQQMWNIIKSLIGEE